MSSIVVLVGASAECISNLARRTPRSIQWVSIQEDSNSTLPATCNAIAFLGSQLAESRMDELQRLPCPILVSPLIGASQTFSDDVQIEIGNSIATLPSRRLVLDQLKSGKLGEPGMIRVHRWVAGSQFSIKNRAQRSLLFEEIDFVLHCYHASPLSLIALPISNNVGVVVHMHFMDGRTAIIDFCVSQTGASYSSFSLIGSSGSANADDHNNVQIVGKAGTLQAIPVRDTENALAGMVLEFVGRRVLRNASMAGMSDFDKAIGTKLSHEILDRIEALLMSERLANMGMEGIDVDQR